MHHSAADQESAPPQSLHAAMDSAIDEYAARHAPAWIDVRRRLHRHPEPSGEEFETSELVRAHLVQHGISARISPRDVGVIGELKIGSPTKDSPVIALRADIDALRMRDRKTTEYASSVEGCAHTCGHDVHTTVMLAVAEILASLNERYASTLPTVTIRFVFQAAEEICKGAQWMVDDGATEDVSAILGIHVDPQLLSGQIGICYGPLTAQIDEVAITIRGKGGHSARPHSTTDPIATTAMLVSLLYQRLPRSVDVRDPAVFTIGQIHGGTASNIIPDLVELSGSLRTTETEVRNTLKREILHACEHVGTLTGNTIAVDFRNPLGGVRNESATVAAFEQAARDTLGEDSIVLLTRPSMGGEDFAVYLDHVPGAQMRLGCAGGSDWPLLHSPVFDVDENIIGIGARVVVRATLQVCRERSLRN